MAARPSKNSDRFRQTLSIVYASATRLGSRVFHASSAIRAFCAALSTVKGGSGGRLILTPLSARAPNYNERLSKRPLWYKLDMTIALTNVRFGGKADIAQTKPTVNRVSFHVFD